MSNKQGVVNIHGKEYLTVALRVSMLREAHPEWGVETEIVSATDDVVIMKAVIKNEEGRIIGTGFAEEKRNASQINRTSALENCETSALGRALAACGLGGTEYASANEVENAIHQQQTQTVKIDPKQKKEFVEQVLQALADGDGEHLKVLWDEWDADEKSVLWASFNSQQRSSMKELTK